jgi:hypothetical protein
MSARTAVLAGRLAAERLMVDTCVIGRPGGWTEDEDGVEVPSETTVYSGKCRVQTYEPYESALTSAGRPVVQQRYQVHLPVSDEAMAVEVGDLVHVAGRRRPLRVGGLFDKTFATAIRLLVDEEANSSA